MTQIITDLIKIINDTESSKLLLVIMVIFNYLMMKEILSIQIKIVTTLELLANNFLKKDRED